MSLMQMIKYAGPVGYLQVALMAALLGLGPIVLARVIIGVRVVLFKETPRALRRMATGQDAGRVVAEWSAVAEPRLRWPHGLLVLGALAAALGVFGWATGWIAACNTIATSPTAPSPRQLADAEGQALTTIMLGSGVLAASLAVYAVAAFVLSAAGMLASYRVRRARDDVLGV